MTRFPKTRIEAFSDGVIAIIITIMVLELRPPNDSQIVDLIKLLPTFFSYLLSFIYLGLYWNNHHHLFQTVQHINGRIMWSNLYLLFWLSLFPFVTAWIGKTHAAPWPTALYGFIYLMASISFQLLQRAIIDLHGDDSILSRAIRYSKKETVSTLSYAAAMGIAFIAPWISICLYVFVAIIWIVPDKRIEGLSQD